MQNWFLSFFLARYDFRRSAIHWDPTSLWSCIQFVFLEDDRKKPQINAHADTLISAAFSGISFSWMTGTIFSEAAAGV